MNLQNTLKKLLVVLFVAIPAFWFTSCDITDPLEGITLLLNLKERNTTVSVVVRDAATGDVVGFDDSSVSLDVTFSGDDNLVIINMLNEEATRLNALEKGLFNFALRDEIETSPQDPLIFRINLAADGYLTESQLVVIDGNGEHVVDVEMIRAQQPPEGVVIRENLPIGAATAQGITNEPILFGSTDNGDEVLFSGLQNRINSRSGNDSGSMSDNPPPGPPISVVSPSVRFFVEAGTEMKDENGSPLQGSLNATFVYFGPNNAVFPRFGKASRDESTDDSIFEYRGIVQAVIQDESGRTARTFDPALEVTMTYPASSFDTEQFESWTGTVSRPDTWNFSQMVSITELEDSFGRNFNQSTMSLPELPLMTMIGNGIPACLSGKTIRFEGTRLRLEGGLFRTDNDRFIGSYNTVRRDIEGEMVTETRFRTVPRNVPARADVRNMNFTLIDSFEVSDLCAQTERTVPVNSPEFELEFIAEGRCADRDEVLYATVPAQIKSNLGNRWRSAGTISKGKLNITLPEPDTYTIGITYDGRFYEYDIDLNNAQTGTTTTVQEIFDIPDNICDEV